MLKKDFHVDPIQLLEAKAIGASAALLIVRALSPDALAEMVRAADELGLEVLLEVRDVEELSRAVDAASSSNAATIIGVNNRNLETLVIDSGRAEELIDEIPARFVAIAESGVSASARRGARRGSATPTPCSLAPPCRRRRSRAPSVRDLTNVARQSAWLSERCRRPAIKFCGLTRAEDARTRRELGASYVGVIFASGPRLLTEDRAAAGVGATCRVTCGRVGVVRRSGADGDRPNRAAAVAAARCNCTAARCRRASARCGALSTRRCGP